MYLLLQRFLGKLTSAGLAAYSSGLNKSESTVVVIGMSASGAVEINIADIALKAGLFHIAGIDDPILNHMFSAIVITVATPILLQQIYKIDKSL